MYLTQDYNFLVFLSLIVMTRLISTVYNDCLMQNLTVHLVACVSIELIILKCYYTFRVTIMKIISHRVKITS